MKAHGDFKDFISLMNAGGVDYVIVGSFALSFHGYPRATADLDVWVAINPANAALLVGSAVGRVVRAMVPSPWSRLPWDVRRERLAGAWRPTW